MLTILFDLRPTLRTPGFAQTAILALSLSLPLFAQSLTPAAAAPIFREGREFALKDHSTLWGMSLEGPMLLVDPQSREVLASGPDREGRLKASEGLWSGMLPKELNVANTAMEWAGVRWTMLVWPLGTDDAKERGVLLMHELYHRIQPELHLFATGPDCGHLDTREGRIWLRLEFRALRAALISQGEARRASLGEALAFRARRRSLFPEAAKSENSLELNEGLAEYTGVRLALKPEEARARTEARLDKADLGQAFMRSFCYVSGPALGLFLDEASPAWRKAVTVDSDLSTLLGSTWKLAPLEPSKVEEAAKRYGSEAVAGEEARRETRRAAHLRDLVRRFKEGPVLFAPMGNIEFNPNTQESVQGLGIFNPNLRLVGPWGILTVTGGCVLASDWSHVRVEAPANPPVPPRAGPGWTLELKPGWTLAPGSRKGNWAIQPEVKP